MPITGHPEPPRFLSSSLRPLPLSQHKFSGACYVLREDNTPVRLHDLAAAGNENTVHRLRGPDGVVEVRVQIGGFSTHLLATTMRTESGSLISFLTTIAAVRQNAEYSIAFEYGYEFLGAVPVSDRLELTRLSVVDVLKQKNVEHYSYSISPCALYIGAGKQPTFLPFEVT